MRDSEPTEAEQIFFDELSRQVPGVHDWYHEDPDGTPWMIASLDFIYGNSIQKTLRVDYDGTNLRGGRSPASLNWDDGVRAHDATIDTSPPDGIEVDYVAPTDAARLAAEWFSYHHAQWHRD